VPAATFHAAYFTSPISPVLSHINSILISSCATTILPIRLASMPPKKWNSKTSSKDNPSNQRTTISEDNQESEPEVDSPPAVKPRTAAVDRHASAADIRTPAATRIPQVHLSRLPCNAIPDNPKDSKLFNGRSRGPPQCN